MNHTDDTAARPFAAMAADTWQLIRALGDPDVGTSMVLKRDADFHDAAQRLIELACESAAEWARGGGR